VPYITALGVLRTPTIEQPSTVATSTASKLRSPSFLRFSCENRSLRLLRSLNVEVALLHNSHFERDAVVVGEADDVGLVFNREARAPAEAL